MKSADVEQGCKSTDFYFIHNFLSELGALLFRLSEMWDSSSIAVGFRLSFLLAFGLKANFQVLSDSWFGARRGSSYYD